MFEDLPDISGYSDADVTGMVNQIFGGAGQGDQDLINSVFGGGGNYGASIPDFSSQLDPGSYVANYGAGNELSLNPNNPMGNPELAGTPSGPQSPAAAGGTNYLDKIMNNPYARMAMALGIPLSATLLGSIMGKSAGKATQEEATKIGQPSPKETELLSQYQKAIGPTDLTSVTNEMQGLMTPGIQRILENERRTGRQLGEEAVSAGVSVGTPLIDLRGRLRENTNRGIAEAINSAVMSTQTNRQNQLATALANASGQAGRQQQAGLTGLQLGNQAASAAGQIPMQVLLLAALLGSQGGLLGSKPTTA